MLTVVYAKSIKLQPSVIGYIAKSVALIGNGKRHKAYRACDIAFERFHANHVSFLLLIKARVSYSEAWFPLRYLFGLGYRRIYGRRAQ